MRLLTLSTQLNASDDRGIDVVREQIKDFADSGKLFKAWVSLAWKILFSLSGLPSNVIKLIVLDEADMMTQTAQAALRRGECYVNRTLKYLYRPAYYMTVIEQYTKNVRFCIICNYVNKIIPAIQSRCTRFRFSPLPSEEIEKRLQTVIEQERYLDLFGVIPLIHTTTAWK